MLSRMTRHPRRKESRILGTSSGDRQTRGIDAWRMKSIFKELKRRRVYRVALGYGIIASAMIQIGGTILPIFQARQWMQQVFIVLIAAGFPMSLVLGWLYDITAEGIQRTPNAKGLRVYSRRQLWLVSRRRNIHRGSRTRWLLVLASMA